MIQSFRLTLYDLFGYFLPGVVVLASMFVFVWAIYFPQFPIPIQPLPVEVWTIAVVVAYFSGHLIQAVGNSVTPLFGKAEDKVFGATADPSCKALTDMLRTKVRSWGVDPTEVNPSWLYTICDETVAQRGAVTDREIFVYREGFYRGTFVALVLLSFAILIRMLSPGASIVASGPPVQIVCSLWLFLFCISALGSWMAFARFRRFAEHRVNRALAGFVVLQGSGSDTMPPGGPAGVREPKNGN